MDESQSIHSDITPALSAEDAVGVPDEALVDGISRRQALRRMAAFGATLAWAAPAVQRLGMAPAHAQTGTNGTPILCECLEEAFALRVVATGLVNIDTTIAEAPEGDPCVADVNLSLDKDKTLLLKQDGHVMAKLLCSNTQECFAEASVAELAVKLNGLEVAATILKATADATGECPPEAGSTLATVSLKLNGIALAVSSAPNTTIHISDPLKLVSGTIAINEEGDECVDGFKRVFANALRIQVAARLDPTKPPDQTLEVIVSHVAVRSCCPC